MSSENSRGFPGNLHGSAGRGDWIWMARAPAPPAGSLCFQISRDGLAVASCSGDLADAMLAQAGAGSWPGKSIGGMFSAMNKRSLFTLKTQETEKFYNN